MHNIVHSLPQPLDLMITDQLIYNEPPMRMIEFMLLVGKLFIHRSVSPG
jgi:hypothetical protein